MNSEQHDNYIILQDERDDIQQFATFLTSIYDQFVDKNLIVDLLKYEAATLMDLLSFLELSSKALICFSKYSFI